MPLSGQTRLSAVKVHFNTHDTLEVQANFKMKNSPFTVGLIVTLSAFLLEYRHPMAVHAQDRCQEAISFVRSDIELRLGGKVSDVTIAENKQSPFADARDEVVFELDANMDRGAPLKNFRASPKQVAANVNVVNSGKLSMGYAKKILGSCKSVARVYFYVYELNQGYSLHEDQVVRKDKCVSPGFFNSNNYVPWGQQICA